jgi:hypothetical protein
MKQSKKILNVNSLNDTISKYRDNWINHKSPVQEVEED